jgi:hypothetical protein
MRLSIKALTYACAIVWGRVVFLAAVANLLWPPSGAAFPGLVNSTWIQDGREPWQRYRENAYTLVDGSIGGAAFTSIYNQITK